MRFQAFLCCSLIFSFLLVVSAQQCGRQASFQLCANNLCCSQFGYCGKGDAYCGAGCQSQCNGLSGYIPESIFNKMVPNQQHSSDCPSQGFYNYEAFLEAAASFPRFASVGDDETRKREIAAFLAHSSHETSGPHASAPHRDHRFECNPNYPCPNEYYGRGPFQLRGNEKYLRCGEAIGEDLINNPDLLVTDAKTSFKSAFWFWMTSQSDNSPSCHEAITGEWKPTAEDESKGWLPGFGLTTNLINGANECGSGLLNRTAANNRLGSYVKYCHLLGASPGDNLTCRHQKPIGPELLAKTM